jgi:hypothetical protein
MKLRIATLCAVALTLLAASWVLADGTESLGPPGEVTLAAGTGIVVAGVGMHDYPDRPNSFVVTVPSGAAVMQVLLYWQGHWTDHAPHWSNVPQVHGDDEISVNGHLVQGTRIGGSTAFYRQSAGALDGTEMFVAYRADITNLGLVGPGASTLTISDMLFRSNFPNAFPFDQGNDGAGVIVIYHDVGNAGSIDLRDGLDLAFAGFAAPLNATVPQTFAFSASTEPRTATLATLAGSVLGPDAAGPRANQLLITFDVGDAIVLDNPWQSNDGHQLDALNSSISIPPMATSLTVQAISGGPNGSPASMAWVAAALVVPADSPPPLAPAVFLVIDEDGIDNGDRYWLNSASSFTASTIKRWSAVDVNDDRPGLAQRLQLRWFASKIGQTFWFWTGQVGDEGWFAPKVIPPSWTAAGPTSDGLRNLLGNPANPFPHGVGPGLGTGSNPESLLDKIPYVTPLRAEGLYSLIGRTVCALVWDSDISINYGPLNGSLKGEKLGVVAFDVLDVVYLSGFSSSTLPRVQVTIRDANEVCQGPLVLFNDAPEPLSSSQPADIRPNFPGDNTGYTYIAR